MTTQDGAASQGEPQDPRHILLWETLRVTLARPSLVAAQAGGVVLLVAIQYFDAGNTAKAVLSSTIFAGLLLSPLVVTIVAGRQIRISRALAGLQLLSACGWLVAGLSTGLTGFTIGILVGVPLLQSSIPLVTSIWQRNVPASRRGRLFGLSTSMATFAGVVSGLLIALYMGDDAGRYRPVMLAMAVLLVLAALAALQLPPQRIRRTVRNPVRLLSLLWENRIFGYLSIVWMILGFGNLATWPLRTEYVASGDYGIFYPPNVVLILTLVIPQAVTLLATPVWGRFFDRADFAYVRLAINATFMASIVFFFTPSLAGQVVGAALLGLGRGGGIVAWNLWVTKYAPDDRTADYMAVHTFLTGARGLVAPFIAYYLLSVLPLIAVTRVSLVLLLFASVMMIPVLLRSRLDAGGQSA